MNLLYSVVLVTASVSSTVVGESSDFVATKRDFSHLCEDLLTRETGPRRSFQEILEEIEDDGMAVISLAKVGQGWLKLVATEPPAGITSRPRPVDEG